MLAKAIGFRAHLKSGIRLIGDRSNIAEFADAADRGLSKECSSKATKQSGVKNRNELAAAIAAAVLFFICLFDFYQNTRSIPSARHAIQSIKIETSHDVAGGIDAAGEDAVSNRAAIRSGRAIHVVFVASENLRPEILQKTALSARDTENKRAAPRNSWYLLVPLLARPTVPFSKWIISEIFDSAPECISGLKEMAARAERNEREHSGNSTAYQNRCIASDDPRLIK